MWKMEDLFILSYCPYMPSEKNKTLQPTSIFLNQTRRELPAFHRQPAEVQHQESWNWTSLLNISILSYVVSSKLVLFRNWIREEFQVKPKMTSWLWPWLICCYKICEMFLLVRKLSGNKDFFSGQDYSHCMLINRTKSWGLLKQ